MTAARSKLSSLTTSWIGRDPLAVRLRDLPKKFLRSKRLFDSQRPFDHDSWHPFLLMKKPSLGYDVDMMP